MEAKKKSSGIPARFDAPEEATIAELQGQTQLSKSEIIRRSVRFAAPKFLSGEINILTLGPGHAPESSK